MTSWSGRGPRVLPLLVVWKSSIDFPEVTKRSNEKSVMGHIPPWGAFDWNPAAI